jgi:hypothetical protein
MSLFEMILCTIMRWTSPYMWGKYPMQSLILVQACNQAIWCTDLDLMVTVILHLTPST